MQNLTQKIGVVTFWTLGEETDRDRLAAGLESVGLANYLPLPQTPAAALLAALRTVYAKDHLIRKLAVPGFEVVSVHEGEDRNQYQSVATVKVDKQTGDLTLWCEGADAAAIRDEYQRQRGILPGLAVSIMLSKITGECLRGTKLRPSGGVYWFDETALERWQSIAAAVELASGAAGKGNRIYVLRHDLDPDSIRAVRDSLVAEVSAESARLNEDIFSGTLKENAMRARKHEANTLLAKVVAYEALLGEGLDVLRVRLVETQGAAAAALMVLATQTAADQVATSSASAA